MKTIWKLRYEIIYESIPGNGSQTKKYKSFSEAKKFIKKMISQIYIFPYTKALREEGMHRTYRVAMADFLDDYVRRKDFLNANDTLPSCDADDYELEKEIIQRDDGEDTNDYDEGIDDLEDFDIYIANDSLSFDCYFEGYPHLNTDMVTMDDQTKDYSFEFYVDKAPKNKLKELQITLTPLQYWGTASYPLLVLRTLENSQKPLAQQEIISQIKTVYDTVIERKAIGRNISLLKDIGYDIQHNRDGYFIPKNKFSFEQKDFQAITESIQVSKVLNNERKHELIDKLSKLL